MRKLKIVSSGKIVLLSLPYRNLPCLGLHATAHALEEGKGDIHRRSGVRRREGRAFVDGVAEDEWLSMKTVRSIIVRDVNSVK